MLLRLALVVFLVPSAAHAQDRQRFSDNLTVPFEQTLYSECTGEEIRFSGRLHMQYNAVEQGDSIRAESSTNYQNVSGVGLSSGTKYRLVGSGKTVVDFRRPFPAHSNSVEIVRLIAQGPEKNAHYKVQWRYTMTGNGKLTGEVDRAQIECRGAG